MKDHEAGFQDKGQDSFGKKKKFPTVRTCKRFCDVRKASASLQQRKGAFNKKKPNQMKLNGRD